jgi:D-3-phosphoglycerate dehydrogenase / 2-oxoglutarate reductase
MFNVAITDYNFRDLSPEEGVLNPAGCSIHARRTVTEAELPELVSEADGIITQFAPITGEVVKAMRRAKVIVRYGVGFDNVDLQAAARQSIPVCNVPDYCVDEVADHALALMLAVTRQIPQIFNRVRQREWRFPIALEKMLTLKNMTVGVLGFGRIGRAVAQRLKGFGGEIIAHDPVSSRAQIESAGVRAVDLDGLLRSSDLITLHCPSTPDTRHLIRAETIAKMKPGAVLINVARGSIIHEPDLISALQDGRIAAAGLDVADPEPILPDNPLLQLDNVIITNHVAAYSASALDRLQRLAAETLLKGLRDEPLPNVVNGVRPQVSA